MAVGPIGPFIPRFANADRLRRMLRSNHDAAPRCVATFSALVGRRISA